MQFMYLLEIRVVNGSSKKGRNRKTWIPVFGQQVVLGHVDQGESYFDAAVRECKEELGAFTSEKDLLELLRLSPCDETGKEFVRVYLRFGNLIPVGDPEEIEAFDLLSLEEIEQKIQAKPSIFSNSFVHIFKLLQVVLKKFT